ncbi:hypothetical protein AURDEDRAFT_110799 [Auricularia subglabra TFB-10046 SS5]|nr:hypothetical protein AURDEDRAFT_110799 [Auricularia subglabra TFB-10046 SS5]
MPADAKTLDVLFPRPPALPTSVLSPTALPGVSEASAAMLVQCLKDNHINFHCFFNDSGFHNHLAHHLFAAYKMGATAPLIEAAYKEHASYQRKAFKSPGPIDAKNWKEHLGDENYYASYLDFFTNEVLTKGMSASVETYVFSDDANWQGFEKDANKAPRMLDRFMAGLVHPIIHFGHGAEFNIPGMAVEGLAWTAVHDTPTGPLLPPDFFTVPAAAGTLSKLTASLSLSSAPKTATQGLHSFTIVARMLKDAALAPGIACKEESPQHFQDVLKNQGELIRAYAKEWAGEITSSEDAHKKVEEISWVAVLIYGLAGWSKARGFRADFFTMHLVTSSLFLSSILPLLSHSSQSRVLRAHFSIALGWWVSRGRPAVDVRGFYAAVSATPAVPVPDPKPDGATLDRGTLVQNPWFNLLQSTLPHPDEHLLKLERTLAHYAALYGDRPKGHWAGTELEGAEELDGSVFVRVAGASLKRLGRVREGEPSHSWDRDGFFQQ